MRRLGTLPCESCNDILSNITFEPSPWIWPMTTPAPSISKLPPGWLVGTWEFTHTTARVCFPIDIYYHFDRRGLTLWECPFEKSYRPPTRPYHETPDGYWLEWPNLCRFHESRTAGDEILSVGVTGDLWWMRRLTSPPGYLRYFVDVANGEMVELGR
jgi:hypothetical protein